MSNPNTKNEITDGFTSVMSKRIEPARSLDFFPTPPWATRALCQNVFSTVELGTQTCWEPACGEGHMALVLREYFEEMAASDIHDYGVGLMVGDFLTANAPQDPFDWIITNPPFNLACEFALRAISLARVGVALLVRSVFAEGGGRYRDLFSKYQPSVIAQFSERVPMVKGRWNPNANSATAYAWFIWRSGHSGVTRFVWIPPRQRSLLTKPTDRERFAKESMIA